MLENQNQPTLAGFKVYRDREAHNYQGQLQLQFIDEELFQLVVLRTNDGVIEYFWAKVGGQENVRWQEMSSAPMDTTFVCRRKSKPWVQFEAIIVWDNDGPEHPDDYKVLLNETNSDEILDDHWSEYQWKLIP